MLELREVSLSIGGTVLVQPFSLSIGNGEIVTLMGASGSGKSSLLSLIGGDLAPDFRRQGDVLLNGASVLALLPERRKVGRLFQDDLLFPHMTVGENLLFAVPRLPRAERLVRVGEALRQAQLEGFAGRPPQSLSGGQRQRVALMRALLAEPDAMLLDEPFSKLDQSLKAQMRSHVFADVMARGIPALLVTHDRADAPVGGRVLMIDDKGKVRDA